MAKHLTEPIEQGSQRRRLSTYHPQINDIETGHQRSTNDHAAKAEQGTDVREASENPQAKGDEHVHHRRPEEGGELLLEQPPSGRQAVNDVQVVIPVEIGRNGIRFRRR